jgi:chromosome partitioning protein
MKVFVISSQKGGVGKTTLTLNLGCAAAGEAKNKVAVLDLDPQQSLSQWYKRRSALPQASVQYPVRVQSVDRKDLLSALYDLKTADYTHVLIDMPPVKKQWMKTVFSAADLVVVPLKPSPFDMDSGFATYLDVLGEDRPVCWVFNGVLPNSKLIRPVANELGKSMEVCSTVVHERVDFVMSAGGGESVLEYAPASKSAAEVWALWAELEAHPEIRIKHRFG